MLKSYVSHQYLWTVRWGKWSYYNFAAGSFHTMNFVAAYIRLKENLVQKANVYVTLSPTLWGLRGNIRTPSIARCKACGRLRR